MRLTLWILGTEILSVSTDTPTVDYTIPLGWDNTETEDEEWT